MKTILSQIQRAFLVSLETVMRFPKITVLCFFLIIAFFGFSLKDSKLELDIYDVHDKDFQSSLDHSEIKEDYRDRSQMLVSFSFNYAPTAGRLCKILKWSKGLTNYSEVKGVTSLWSIRAPKVEGSRLWYPRLLEDPCELPSDFVVDLKSNFENSFFRHMLSKTGAKDLVFDVSFSGKDKDTSQVQHVIDITDNFIKDELSDVKVSYLGLGGSRYYFKKIMFKDSIYNILVVVLILLLLRILYGTWRSGVFLALTLVSSNIILYGSMAVLGISVDILTNNLFLMVAVAATADFIFVTQAQFTETYENSLKNYIFPCFMTTFTTVIGFLSLNTSDLDIIKKFGTAAAVGAIVEWIMMFMLLPPFLKILKQDKVWVNPARSISFAWIERLEKIKLPKFVLRTFIILMIGSIPSFFFLNTQDSPVENLPSNHVMREGYENFERKFGWEGQVFLYFPVVPQADELKSVVKKIESIELVSRVENPQELIENWTDGLPELKKELIARELSMTPLWERYYSNMGTLRIPLYLKEQDLHSLQKFRDQIGSICNNKCRLAGQRVVYLEYGEKIGKTMIESFGASILLVSFIIGLLLWSQGRIKEFKPFVISAMIGPLTMLSLIALFQIPVTLITSIFLAVMVGLAGDNAIQYILAETNDLEEGIKSRSRASIVVTMVMMLGSIMFILQSLLPMKILGILFISGFFINFAGDLWGLKSMVDEDSD